MVLGTFNYPGTVTQSMGRISLPVCSSLVCLDLVCFSLFWSILVCSSVPQDTSEGVGASSPLLPTDLECLSVPQTPNPASPSPFAGQGRLGLALK